MLVDKVILRNITGEIVMTVDATAELSVAQFLAVVLHKHPSTTSYSWIVLDGDGGKVNANAHLWTTETTIVALPVKRLDCN